jgi:cell division protein FtsB
MWWLVIIVFALLIPEILSTILDSRLGRAVALQIENRGASPETEALNDRIRYLEAEVERLSDEVHRLADESEFYQQLLSERASQRPPSSGLRTPPGERRS